ncbi:sensor histidine kinase [Salinadaptatus halalkaliphilus]|uniref:sensor histidine kinase n=1 Tax=Salinadaptatus halalkaliphilus TaxID=2419781 RepID=UPI001FE53873|nr:histidine kinase dimerization/phospho-acceptor domain-containing protein [Salinadaptatus halalkaliphilus]
MNTRDITDRKQREREIRRSNEQLERFADVVSHDLRNPLNVAQGYLELASDDIDCAYHDDIELAHDRMAAIIEDVLRLAREGQPIDDTEPVDLERVLEYGETSSGSGTGFGLAIVDEIADGHGWTLRITESADGGARFEFDTGPTSRTSAATRSPSADDA